MNTIDLDAIVRAAVERDRVQQLEAMRTIVREELERREQDRLLDAAALAKYLGKPSTAALQMWLKPGRGGAELSALAVDAGGRRAWRKSDVDAWLARRSSK